MNQKYISKFQNFPRGYLTDVELGFLLESSPNSRYGKVKRLLKQGNLVHIRRGLYYLTKGFGIDFSLHPFELAQPIYGPSYISLESALSYHKLIPEAVYTVTSVCIKRSKDFKTPLGNFVYLKLPEENFYAEVDLISDGRVSFFMAKPWKAICDYIFCYKKDWSSLDPLVKSLRINIEDLPILTDQEIDTLKEYYHHQRISRFLKCIQRDLNL